MAFRWQNRQAKYPAMDHDFSDTKDNHAPTILIPHHHLPLRIVAITEPCYLVFCEQEQGTLAGFPGALGTVHMAADRLGVCRRSRSVTRPHIVRILMLGILSADPCTDSALASVFNG